MATNYLPSNHDEEIVEKDIYEVKRSKVDNVDKLIFTKTGTIINLNDYSFYNYQSVNETIQEPEGSYMKITYGDETHYIISDGKPFPKSNNGKELIWNKSALLTHRKHNYYSYVGGTTSEKTNYFYDVASSFMGAGDSTGFSNFTWRSVPGFKIGKRDLTCWAYVNKVKEDEPAFKNDSYFTSTTPKKFNFSESYRVEEEYNTFGSTGGGTWSIKIDNNKELFINNAKRGVLDDRTVLVLYYRKPSNNITINSVYSDANNFTGRKGSVNLDIRIEASANVKTDYMFINTAPNSTYEFREDYFLFDNNEYSYGESVNGQTGFFSSDPENWLISNDQIHTVKDDEKTITLTGEYLVETYREYTTPYCPHCKQKNIEGSIDAEDIGLVEFVHGPHKVQYWTTTKDSYGEWLEAGLCSICGAKYGDNSCVTYADDGNEIQFKCTGLSHRWISNYEDVTVMEDWNLTVKANFYTKTKINYTVPKFTTQSVLYGTPSWSYDSVDFDAYKTASVYFKGNEISYSSYNGGLNFNQYVTIGGSSASSGGNRIAFSFSPSTVKSSSKRAFMLVAITPNDVERDEQ